MDYLDIWFFDRRPRMKVFFCYLLIFIAFFIFSDFMIYGYTKSLYKPIESYKENITSAEVTIETAEASNVNGNVKGKIKNTGYEDLQDKCLKFDFYTPRDVNVGTKYVKIGSLAHGAEEAYELGFKYDYVKYVKVSMVDIKEMENATSEELKLDPTYGPAGLLSVVILGYFFL